MSPPLVIVLAYLEIGPQSLRKDRLMSVMRIRPAVIRLMGIVAIAAGLAFSATAAAAPLEFGIYECGIGECVEDRDFNFASSQSNPTAGEPLGPHFTP